MVFGLLLLILAASLVGFNLISAEVSKFIAMSGVGVYVIGLLLFATRGAEEGSEKQI
jgi:hypothetical protein